MTVEVLRVFVGVEWSGVCANILTYAAREAKGKSQMRIANVLQYCNWYLATPLGILKMLQNTHYTIGNALLSTSRFAMVANTKMHMHANK